MSLSSKLFLAFISGVVIGVVLYELSTRNSKIDRNNIIINDTTYNHIILDSIQYNIIRRDSIIKNIKEKQYEKVEEIKHYSDSASIELFYELLSK